jgi:hypothetical protein
MPIWTICLWRNFRCFEGHPASVRGELKGTVPLLSGKLIANRSSRPWAGFAQYLVQEILKHSTDDSKSEVQGPKEHQSGINPTRPSRRRKRLDLTYRLPKSSRAQAHISRDGPGVSHAASGSSPLVGDGSVTCQPGHDYEKLLTTPFDIFRDCDQM